MQCKQFKETIEPGIDNGKDSPTQLVQHIKGNFGGKLRTVLEVGKKLSRYGTRNGQFQPICQFILFALFTLNAEQ